MQAVGAVDKGLKRDQSAIKKQRSERDTAQGEHAGLRDEKREDGDGARADRAKDRHFVGARSAS